MSDSDNDEFFEEIEDDIQVINETNVKLVENPKFYYLPGKSDEIYVLNYTAKFLNETRNHYSSYKSYTDFIMTNPCYRIQSSDCDEVFAEKIYQLMDRTYQDKAIPFFSAYLIVSMLNNKIRYGIQYSNVIEKMLEQFH